MAKQILVTGGNGFLGDAVLAELQDRQQNFLYTYRSQAGRAPEQGLQLDLTQPADYAKYTEQLQAVDCLVHTAATVSHALVDQPAKDLEAQVITSLQILKNLLEALPNLQRLVYVSSCSAEIADTDPSFYGLGKRIMEEVVEHYCQQQGLNYVIVRFPQLYGPGEPHGTFVSKFITALMQDEPIRLVNDGEVVRDVLYVKEAAHSIMMALETDKNGTVTINDPAEHTVKEILTILEAHTGKTAQIEAIQDPEAVGKSVHFASTAESFGYQLRYTLEEGLQETVDEWRKTQDV